MDIEVDYIDKEYYPTDQDMLSPMEADILKVLNTYLTIMKYLVNTGNKDKKEIKKDIKKAQKMKQALMKQDGSIKKYLREDGEYYGWL